MSSTIYWNHAGTSWPKPACVIAAAERAIRADPADWADTFDAAHRRVAAFFRVDDPARLLLTPGCTSALALGVTDHAWKAGDCVVTSGLEHHALHRPLAMLAEQGVEVEVLPRSSSEPIVLEALEALLRRGRVRMVALSAASNVTGELLPVARAIELAHEHGALAMIDGAQVAGWRDLDLPDLGADLFAFAGHKGLQAPWGIGGLYVAPGVNMRSPAATCEVPVGGGAPACATMPGYCDGGSVDRIALAGLAAAADWLSDPARAERLPRARAVLASLREVVATIPGVRIHGPADVSAGMPTLALTFERATPAALGRALADRGIVAGTGLQCAPLAHQTLGTAPDGVLRLSAGPGTTLAEATETAEAIRELVATNGQ